MRLTPADETFRTRLTNEVPEEILRPVADRYLEEPRGKHTGQGGLLALPKTVDQVAALVRLANAAKVGVVPYGGGTGLVGGQILPGGPAPLILSLERMNQLRGVYPEENVLVAEAGMILADVQAAADGADRLFPLSLAAEGMARIGGNLATNAGGTGVLRYGNARDLCLGLEAVLPDGQIWHGLSRLRKDNTGYDLRHLLIGAEGTLGVITAAALKLYPKPAAMGTAMMVVRDPQAALDLLNLSQGQLGNLVSTFELIDGQGLAFLAETHPNLRLPFASPPPWSVLVEVGGIEGMDPAACLEGLFERGAAAGLVLDGLIAQSTQQAQDFWQVREMIPEANRRVGAVASHDLSVPLGAIPAFIDRAAKAIAGLGNFRINCFGHLGDGNLHYNVFPLPGETRAQYDHVAADITRVVHDLTQEFAGSVSAEHGIGRLKVTELERYGDPAKLSAMRAIKAALDPQGIMNPGAVVRFPA